MCTHPSYLVEGVAFASIDYRLLQSPDPDGVIKSLTDSTRALQFIRYHSQQLNDDMADPGNEDPSGETSTDFALRHFGL